ncbi:MAG: ubiquinone/menaquinone biosynthesis methyltransferase [Verrucomicrobiota bacterium]|nr:ubiquinone/menaquinone biosynthesis methyltransferase [Limisphaera sp.]MDW8381975.1 ubiquinone/menaquinone biosynthesis methyltransferase [Verrucomicrobiota bacterium]
MSGADSRISPESGSQPTLPTERAVRVRALFDRIAWRYDFINDLQSAGLHRLWKRRVAQLAAVGPGHRVLDVCCGTGDVARELARTGAEVVAVDFSEQMLNVARRRSRRWGPWAGRITFLWADALCLPFEERAFDAVTIAYGLRNLADWRAGLRELLRVTRPGGRLVILEFGIPNRLWWRRVYYGYLRWFVPFWGWCFAGDRAAYAYILNSLVAYPGQHGVAKVLNEMGCREVQVYNLIGGAMSLHRAIKGAAERLQPN